MIENPNHTFFDLILLKSQNAPFAMSDLGDIEIITIPGQKKRITFGFGTKSRDDWVQLECVESD